MNDPHAPEDSAVYVQPRHAEGRPRPRFRERAVERGVESMRDGDLLAMLVEHGNRGEGVEARVDRLLREAGGLAGVASRGVGGLVDELGLGLACSARIAAGIELGLRVARRLHEAPVDAATSSADVERWARRRLLHLAHEELWVLFLDARNGVIGERMIGRGGVHACAVTARDVFRPVVREGRGGFVLVHNHPGGDPIPSREDVAFTRRVVAAAEHLGVELVDHVVVARDGAVSLRGAGLLDELETDHGRVR